MSHGEDATRGADQSGSSRPVGRSSEVSRGARVANRAAREVRAALRPFTIPNGITLLRLALIPFFVLATVENRFGWALLIFVVAGISDALDGFLARVLRMRSLLGSYLDPIADKLLLVAAYISLTWLNPGEVAIPVWLAVMSLLRDLLIVLVALLLYLAADVRSFAPSMWGKATTFFHIVTVGVVLAGNVTPLPEGLLLGCFYTALGLVIISGLDYVRRAGALVETLQEEEHGPARRNGAGVEWEPVMFGEEEGRNER